VPKYICQSTECFNSKAHNYGRFESETCQEICPRCGCEDIVWIPTRHNGSAASVDATLKSLADRYKMTDMGQRGGTRPGEIAKHLTPSAPAEKFVNVQGVNVPVGNGITSGWATTTNNTTLKPAAGAPYAGLKTAAAIPTKVVAAYKGT
jgi:hypothetical protein